MSEQVLLIQEAIVDAIYRFDFHEASTLFPELADILAKYCSLLSVRELEFLNQILDKMLDAFQHHDFQLVADMMQYELRPFIQDTSAREGGHP